MKCQRFGCDNQTPLNSKGEPRATCSKACHRAMIGMFVPADVKRARRAAKLLEQSPK